MEPIGAMRGSRPRRTMRGTNPTGRRAMMTTTDARLEVLAAALRAFAQVLTAEQSAAAAALFLRYAEPLGRQALPSSTDQVVPVVAERRIYNA